MSEDTKGYAERVRELFAERFFAYRYPFRSANKAIAALDKEGKLRYVSECARVVSGDVWKTELGGLYRSLIYSLAMETKNDDERTAYRLMLLLLDRWEERLNSLAKLKDSIKVADELRITLDDHA